MTALSMFALLTVTARANRDTGRQQGFREGLRNSPSDRLNHLENPGFRHRPS